MAGVKYSKQREMIMEYLKSTTAHPTAETVYMNVRSANPKLSLGTVYRNLKLLSEAGEIQRLSCGDGIDRFDATVAPHCHFLCDRCGSVQDVDMPPLDELEIKAAEKLDGEIHGHQVYFYGLCEKCLKEAKNLG